MSAGFLAGFLVAINSIPTEMSMVLRINGLVHPYSKVGWIRPISN